MNKIYKVQVAKKKAAKKTQTSEIIKWFEKGNTLTSKEAFTKFGATRLSAIVYSLRNNYNMAIVSRNVIVPTRYGLPTSVSEYRLEK